MDVLIIPRVIVVEDDPDLNMTIVSFLNLSGFHAEGVRNAKDFEVWRRANFADLLVVDLGLPDCDGLSVVETFRAFGRNGIVIMTARGKMEDRLKGYTSGADNYLVKPVDLRELVLVLRSVFHRMNINWPIWKLSEVEWRLVCPAGSNVRLTRSEFNVVKALTLRAGLTVSREELSKALGIKYQQTSLPRLEIMVRRLRKKISDTTGCEAPIETVRSIGYAFTASIRMI